MSTPLKTGRRNLGQRIDRFISALEREGREPTPFEAHEALTAIGHLAADQFTEGEDAMMWAERVEIAPPSRLAAVRQTAEPVTMAHLRKKLATILATH